jgi:uncharacterized membrane protein/ribosomal protein L40E
MIAQRRIMFCPKCGTENPDSASFCQKCGEPLAPKEAKPTGTSVGLEPNLAGLLCYALGWITGVIFFLLEKENKFVRFHALQSIVTFGAFTVLWIVFSILTYIRYIGTLFEVLNILSGILAFVLWIVLMVKAYQGEKYKLPVAGDMAEKYL